VAPAEPEERRHVLGFPVGPDPNRRPSGVSPHVGLPGGVIGPVDRDFFRSLTHPLRSFRRWRRHGRLGPYDAGGDPSG
jgi:hypothetical protein